MKIQVTQQDISAAETDYLNGKDKRTHCPTAQALIRLGIYFHAVNKNNIRRTESMIFDCIPLPVIARDAEKRFDEGKSIEPFEFEIKL